MKRILSFVPFIFLFFFAITLFHHFLTSFSLDNANASGTGPSCTSNGFTCVGTCAGYCDTSGGGSCPNLNLSCGGTSVCCTGRAVTPTPTPGACTIGNVCSVFNPATCCGTNRCLTPLNGDYTQGTCQACLAIGTQCHPHVVNNVNIDNQGDCCNGLVCAPVAFGGATGTYCQNPTPTPTNTPTPAPPPSCTSAPYFGTCVDINTPAAAECQQYGGQEFCLTPSDCGRDPATGSPRICAFIKATPTPFPTPAGGLQDCYAVTNGQGICRDSCITGSEFSVEPTVATDCELGGRQCCQKSGCGAKGGLCETDAQLKANKNQCPYDYVPSNYDCGPTQNGESVTCCAPSSCYQGNNTCGTQDYCARKGGTQLDPNATNTECRNSSDTCCQAPYSAFNFGTCAGSSNSICTDGKNPPDPNYPNLLYQTESADKTDICSKNADAAGVPHGTQIMCCPIIYATNTNSNIQASIYGNAAKTQCGGGRGGGGCGASSTVDNTIICTNANKCPIDTTQVSKETIGTTHPINGQMSCVYVAQANGAANGATVLGCQFNDTNNHMYGTCTDGHFAYCTNYTNQQSTCPGNVQPLYISHTDTACGINAHKNGLSDGHPVYCYQLGGQNLGTCAGKQDTVCTDAPTCPGGRDPLYSGKPDPNGPACLRAAKNAGVNGNTIVSCCPLDDNITAIPTQADSNSDTTRQTSPLNPCSGTTCNTALGNLSTQPSAFITDIFRIVLGVSGGIAILLIIKSGYQFLISRGNPEKLQNAKEVITSAIVGLLFLIFSVAILEIIGVDILQIPGITK